MSKRQRSDVTAGLVAYHHSLGIALGARGEVEAGIDSLETALRLKPDLEIARGALEHLRSHPR